MVNGGGGLRLTRLRSTEPTLNVPASTAAFACHRQVCVVQVELVEPLAVQMGQPRGERRAGRGDEHRLDGPVFARPENLDLGFALADQPQRDRLHPAGAAAAGQFAPQHRRQREAHQIVQRAARHVGLDQRLIEVARMLDRLADGVAGDLVEADAADVDAFQRVLVLQHGADVPGDRLALAIRVGGEIEGFRAFQRLGDGADLLVAAGVRFPVHGEVLVGADAAILGRQVAHVPETGQDGVAAAQIAVDGFGFGGGFYDDNIRH